MSIAKHNLKMFFNNKLGILFLLAPVILSTVILGKIAISQELLTIGKVGMIASTENKMVEEVKENLKDKFFRVEEVTEDQIDEQIKKGKIDAAIKVEEDGVAVFYPDGSGVGKQIEGIVTVQMATHKLLQQMSGGDVDILDTLKESYQNKMPTLVTGYFVEEMAAGSAFGMFIFVFLMIVGVSLSPMMRDREGKVFERIQVAPIKKYEYVLGHVLGSLCILSVQIMLQGIAFKLLKVNAGIDTLGFILIGIVLAVVGISISLVILAFTKKVSYYYMVIGLGVTPLAMMSDCLVPIEMMPQWIQDLSYISPVRWVMIAYKEMVGGTNVGTMLYALSIALVISVVLILIHIVKEQHTVQN